MTSTALHKGGGTTTDAGGVLNRALDASNPPTEGTIDPNSTWNFQILYRDPAGGAGLNLSDGRSIPFAL